MTLALDSQADDQQLETTEKIIRQRLEAMGVRGADVSRSGEKLAVTVTADSEESARRDWDETILRPFELRFREVLGQIPYATSSATTATGARDETCRDGEAVTENASDPAVRLEQVVLPDVRKEACYVAGPTLLTGDGIESAVAVVDPVSAAWVVTVRFANDDFVKKVAEPLVGKQIAIELDGVVLTSPTINPGITGREVQINGAFTEAEANALARLLPDPLPAPVTIASIKPASG